MIARRRDWSESQRPDDAHHSAVWSLPYRQLRTMPDRWPWQSVCFTQFFHLFFYWCKLYRDVIVAQVTFVLSLFVKSLHLFKTEGCFSDLTHAIVWCRKYHFKAVGHCVIFISELFQYLSFRPRRTSWHWSKMCFSCTEFYILGKQYVSSYHTWELQVLGVKS